MLYDGYRLVGTIIRPLENFTVDKPDLKQFMNVDYIWIIQLNTHLPRHIIDTTDKSKLSNLLVKHR